MDVSRSVGWRVPSGCLDGSLDGGQRSCGVRDEQDRGARAAEGDGVDSQGSGERKQDRKQGAGLAAVRLVDTVASSGQEKLRAVQSEGGEQERGGLDIQDGVCAGVLGREQGASLGGGEPR